MKWILPKQILFDIKNDQKFRHACLKRYFEVVKFLLKIVLPEFEM